MASDILIGAGENGLGASPSQFPGVGQVVLPKKIIDAQKAYAQEVQETYNEIEDLLNKEYPPVEVGSIEESILDSQLAILKAMKMMLKGNMPIEA